MYEKWFSQTVFVEDAGNRVTVRVPNELCRDWLNEHYGPLLAMALTDLDRDDCSVHLVAATDRVIVT